jgi:hypothetical protein
MRFIVLPVLFFLPLFSSAQTTHEAGTRLASAQERETFDAFYAQRFPGSRPAAPVFDIARKPDGRWSVAATVDAAPTRGYASLCRMSRMHFSYDAGAKKDRRWSEGGPSEQYAWLDGAAGCPVPAHPVRLAQHLPDTDVVGLIQQQAPLLKRARLLLAGSTRCAELRSYNFTLAALEIGAPAAGMEELFGLVFQSDHQRGAHVWVRKSGQELTAWNVSCPP